MQLKAATLVVTHKGSTWGSRRGWSPVLKFTSNICPGQTLDTTAVICPSACCGIKVLELNKVPPHYSRQKSNPKRGIFPTEWERDRMELAGGIRPKGQRLTLMNKLPEVVQRDTSGRWKNPLELKRKWENWKVISKSSGRIFIRSEPQRRASVFDGAS